MNSRGKCGLKTEDNLLEMEKAREFLKLSKEESESVLRLTVPPHKVEVEPSFYEDFALRGIQVDRFEPGVITCSFKVPARLTDRDGKLARGAIVSIIDITGGSVGYIDGQPMNISTDMSISFLSTAQVNDELEIVSRLLGRKGDYAGTIITLKNKTTGDLIAEGRHSMFVKHFSRL